MTKTSPYGTWVSPVTTDMACGKTMRLSELSADGDRLFWLEGRPAAQGRTALVCRMPNGEIRDVSPPDHDVRNRVNEYGGGSYVAKGGLVVWSNSRDDSVWLFDQRLNTRPTQLAAVEGCRFADFRFMADDGIVCVREDHRGRPEGDPEAAIVRLPWLWGLDAHQNDGQVLVCGADFYAYPRPSHDGRQLAWISWNHPDMPWDATTLCVARVDGGRLHDLVTVAGSPGESVLQPEWSPQGDLHFISDRNGRWSVYQVGNLAAETLDILPALSGTGEVGGPLWNLGSRWYGFTPEGEIMGIQTNPMAKQGHAHTQLVYSRRRPHGFAADMVGVEMGECPVFPCGPAVQGRVSAMAFLSERADRQPAIELAWAKAGGLGSRDVQEVEAVRNAGPNVLKAEDVSLGVHFDFPTTGGEVAHAFWYPPVNAGFSAPQGERPPLVVMAHGGPTGATSSGLDLAIQWWTSRGFGVVDVNYRGSTGYGRAYRDALKGEWGVADVEDCVAAVHYLVAQGLVDPDRVAIRGSSAGGYTALAALVSSDVFRVGASLYGIGDLTLLAGDTHKFEARYMDQLIGPWPEASDIYTARSPIAHVDSLNAPVIFFQGLDDKVVPPSQARMMVDTMAAQGLTVAHYEFEGEGHGFRGAEAMRRTRELELDFYGKVFGFEPPGLSERVVLVEAADLASKPMGKL